MKHLVQKCRELEQFYFRVTASAPFFFTFAPPFLFAPPCLVRAMWQGGAKSDTSAQHCLFIRSGKKNTLKIIVSSVYDFLYNRHLFKRKNV